MPVFLTLLSRRSSEESQQITDAKLGELSIDSSQAKLIDTSERQTIIRCFNARTR